jgi:hydroxysqualene synthase
MSTDVVDLASGKGHRDENFPVASVLLKPEHRAPIMALYRFARAADDVSDHPTADAHEKLSRLADLRRGLDGQGAEVAVALAQVTRERGLNPVHAHELLDAFVLDVTVNRYADWEQLMGYCRLSAMPVGRFVLDVHGEDRAVWPLSDALCAALQVINHLQDCAKDYAELDRVYLTAEALEASGARIGDLAHERATPELLQAIRSMATRTSDLLRESALFASAIRDRRLAAEVAVIQRFAESLVARLMARDPLSERVHHTKAEAGWLAAGALLSQIFARRRR